MMKGTKPVYWLSLASIIDWIIVISKNFQGFFIQKLPRHFNEREALVQREALEVKFMKGKKRLDWDQKDKPI